MRIAIVGAGIGGLTTALALHRAGIAVTVYEAAPEIRQVGVGINLLPHATRVLAEVGLLDALRAVAVETREAAFFDAFGKLIYREPMGLFGGFHYPQFSIHRGDLQGVLLAAVRERLGVDAVRLGHRLAGFEAGEEGVNLRFESGAAERADALIAADGFHSVVRAAFFPAEGPAVYSGINMWRGAAPWPRFLSGASMVRAGSLRVGKMVIYPIREDVNAAGDQLVNWVAEIRSESWEPNDWNKPGRLEDFLPHFENWRFDWLDVPALIRSTPAIYEYPMVDRDPLPHWSRGPVTLLGDAAHPMYPRGSNGAAQAILDAEAVARELSSGVPPADAFRAYEAERRPKTAAVVLKNRSTPPDFLIETVFDRTGGKPFERIDDVISQEELAGLLRDYQRVAGWDRESLAATAS